MQSNLARAFATLEAELDSLVPHWENNASLVARAQALSEGYTGPDAHADKTPGRPADRVPDRDRDRAGKRQLPDKRTKPPRHGVEPGTHAPAATPALDAQGRAAYLAYFAPRALAALAALGPQSAAFDGARVFDLGAGTGAASLWAAYCGAARIALVDHDPSALAGAVSLLRRAGVADPRPIERSLVAADIPAGAVVVSAFTVGETVLSQTLRHAEEEETALDFWLDLLAPASKVVLVDAGDRDHGRVLQKLRLRALARGMRVLAPCPHAQECPALTRERDWCHTRAARHLSPKLAAFATRVGRDVEQLAYSSLVLEPTPAPEVEAKTPGMRVLAPLLHEKGRFRLPVCGPEGIRFVQVKKRDKQLVERVKTCEVGEIWSHVPGTDIRDQTLHLSPAELEDWDRSRGAA